MASEAEREERVATISTFVGIAVGAVVGGAIAYLLTDFDSITPIRNRVVEYRIVPALWVASLVVFGFLGRKLGLKLWWRFRY